MRVIPSLLILSLNATLFAEIINVPDEYPTIQAALTAADSSDTVLVQPDTYYENIFWPEVNGIKLISNGDSSNTVIDGGGISSVIYVNPTSATIDTTTLIQGFKITNGGNVQYGGGIFLSGADVVFTRLLISENVADHSGGGIYCSNANPIFKEIMLFNNEAKGLEGGGGGICIDNANPIISDVIVKENVISSGNYTYGAGVYIIGGSPQISRTIICSNANSASTGNGGGVYIKYSSASFNNVEIIGNSAECNGAGIYFYFDQTSLIDVVVSYNHSDTWGGGIYLYNSSPTFTRSAIVNNTADAAGGVFIDGGAPTMTDVIISGNNAIKAWGGGLYIGGNAQFTNVVVGDNTANQEGGGMLIEANPTFNNVTITRNKASREGGAVFLFSGSPIFLG